jgi:diacylglycerol kinase family enzyme
MRVTRVSWLADWPSPAGRPLIVAVSGDGVYNEIVNGVMDVTGSDALTALAAGGNANDHGRSTRRMPLVDAIVAAHLGGHARHLDLLRITVRAGETRWSQYPHSYVGLGLTPLTAVGLKRDRRGTVAELVSVLRTFTGLAPVEIVRAGGRHELFEVVSCRHGQRWRIAAMALRAITVGLGPQPRVDRVEFATVDAVPVQIDGEIFDFEPASEIVIDSVPQALATVG